MNYIVYRGEKEPQHKKGVIWIHHTIEYDLESPLIAQVWLNNEWVDRTEEFSATPYVKPIEGIPYQDLSQEIKDKLDIVVDAYTEEETDALLLLKADKVTGATNGNFAGLDSNGNLTDSGKKSSDFATSTQGEKADTAYQKPNDGIPKADLDSGVQTSLGKADTALQTADISHIEEVIPSTATSTNKLTDQNFVNSSVATATATFRGTYNIVTDLDLSVSDTQIQIAFTLGQTITNADNNDYCFVQIPTSDATPTQIARIDRYKFTSGTPDGSWVYEYSLNNSSFTAAQWAAINSGLASSDKDKLDGIASGAQVNVIEHIKINGTEQTISDKSVNLPAYPSTLDNIVDGSTRKLSDYKTINSLKSKGNSTTPVYFDSAGGAQPITSYSGNSNTATKLFETTKDNQEFKFRPSGGDGVNYLKRIKGKSLAWNQLNGFNDFGTGYGNVTTSKDDNDVVTIVIGAGGPSTGLTMGWEKIVRWYVKGHKYLFSCDTDFVMSQSTLRFGPSSWAWFTNNRSIWSGSNDPTEGVFGARAEVGATPGTYHFSNIMLIDLTLLYGSAIDGMTDAEILAKFESEYPGYHEYSAGKLISNDASALETVGFNQWDEEYEKGTISNSTGQKEDANDALRSINYIPVIPGASYYFKGPANSIIIHGYDENKNFYGAYSSGSWVNNGATWVAGLVITIPSGVHYLRFKLGSAYGTTYNHDICINLSDASRNGQYEPYWKRTLPLGLNSFKVKDGQGNVITITGGLKSAGSVYDEIVGNKYVKKVESVDLGGASVMQSSQVANAYVFDFGTSIAQPTSSTIQTAIVNAVCERYIAVAYKNIADKTMAYRQSSSPNARGIIIKDSAWNGYSESQVRTAMSGVMLYYELATPETYELVEPFFPAVMVDELGTEQAIYPTHADGSPSAAFKSDNTYGYGADTRQVSNYLNYLNDMLIALEARIVELENNA